jgi:membrane fusion protein (multidrug efflux system)
MIKKENLLQFKIGSIFLPLFALLLLISCNDKPQQVSTQIAEYPVLEIPLKTVTSFTSYPARLEGTTNSDVRAKMSGYITDVLVDEGQAVRKGQLLFRLETQSLSQDAEAAQANVNAVQVEVDRLIPLVEKNIISSVQLETAKARLAQAKSAYNSIRANINYANIQSPVDGFVGSIRYRKGSLVSPNDATPLTTVADTRNMYAYFALSERDYITFLQTAQGETLDEKIKNMPKVQLVMANGSIYEHQGTIETVTGQIDRQSGTVSFRAIFPNSGGLLANGSSGSIRVPRIYDDVLVAPEISTFEQQGVVYVYRVQGDTIAIATPITIKERVNQMVVIASGVEKGQKIVAQGVGRLRTNTAITPKPVEFDSIMNSFNTVFQ